MEKRKKQDNVQWVDVHDEQLMIKLGIRPKDLEPRDLTVWTKSDKEKKILKRLRRIHKHSLSRKSAVPEKHIPFYNKLIILIKPNEGFTSIDKNGKKYLKTIYSTYCWQHEIPFILNKYVTNKGTNLVIKYNWNGREYEKGTLPFWH